MGDENRLKRRTLSEQLRLVYYNRYLLDNGMITKREHAQMYTHILAKHGDLRNK